VTDPAPHPLSDDHSDDEPPVAALPDGLLAPLLELAGDVLRALSPADVPVAARRLAAFDRRGLATPAARAQLRRLLDTDEQVAAAVADAYARSPEAAAALEHWDPDQSVARVARASGDGQLPVLVSALYTVRPAGWVFALGLAVATFEARRAEAELAEQMRVLEERAATLEEANRRAEVAKAAAEAQTETLDAQLKQARRARRAEEERVLAELAAARARVEELEADLAEAVRRRGEAEAQVKAEARRATAEQRARTEAVRLAAEAAAAPEAAPAPPPGPDPAAVAEAAATAARLAEAISAAAGLTDTLREAADLAGRLGRLLDPNATGEPASGPAPASEGATARSERPRRSPVQIPPGMMADTPEAAEAMVRTPGLAVVVDGYNVSMLAWPEMRVAEQRERLFGALAEFQLRTRVEVTLVFDGAAVAGVRPPRKPGLRVVFSAPGQEADEVVVQEVGARSLDVPVLVVSSDAWVRRRAEGFGAQVLPSAVFLALLRR
jgi:YacP-like NYN domain-containing protein